MNANQLNSMFKRAGLPIKLRSGGSYYYWVHPCGDIMEGTNSPCVYRAEDWSPDYWMTLARAALLDHAKW
jgi:hypothetical protein